MRKSTKGNHWAFEIQKILSASLRRSKTLGSLPRSNAFLPYSFVGIDLGLSADEESGAPRRLARQVPANETREAKDLPRHHVTLGLGCVIASQDGGDDVFRRAQIAILLRGRWQRARCECASRGRSPSNSRRASRAAAHKRTTDCRACRRLRRWRAGSCGRCRGYACAGAPRSRGRPDMTIESVQPWRRARGRCPSLTPIGPPAPRARRELRAVRKPASHAGPRRVASTPAAAWWRARFATERHRRSSVCRKTS
jgi:hypothetical protein